LTGLSDETQAMELPAGCGKFPRETLELAAIAKTDRGVPVDERLAPLGPATMMAGRLLVP
jgi:hypothetical protein